MSKSKFLKFCKPTILLVLFFTYSLASQAQKSTIKWVIQVKKISATEFKLTCRATPTANSYLVAMNDSNGWIPLTILLDKNENLKFIGKWNQSINSTKFQTNVGPATVYKEATTLTRGLSFSNHNNLKLELEISQQELNKVHAKAPYYSKYLIIKKGEKIKVQKID